MSRVSKKPIADDAVSPVQAPVEEPIINTPFAEPKQHWVYAKDGTANKMPGRRRASYTWTSKRIGSAQQELEGIGADSGSDDLTLVNALREDVRNWRETDYENATQVTKTLLRHWRRDDRARPFFFCQLEAVETVIYLNEILASGRKPRRTPKLSPEDYRALVEGRKPKFIEDIQSGFFPTLTDKPLNPQLFPKSLTRYGCKMATGSGKTVVMAMLIAWSLCNRGAVPGDTRFPNAVLVVCPNLTVKDRLQVLRPDSEKSNYYTEFDIIPTAMLPHLQTGKVVVSNWHAFAPESEHSEGGKNYTVVNKGKEGPEAFARRVIPDLFGRGEILVLNDEAHHAYRPAADKDSGKDGGEIAGIVTDAYAREATVWIEGLDKLNQAVGVRFVGDLSATPFFLAGSGHIEGAPFPWLVSDFGLVDAIESGITKIPRLPVADTTGRPDPKFFKLWEDIKSRLGATEMTKGKPKPGAAWREAEPALAMLASQWKERFALHAAARPGSNFIPPALIVVCDNTDMAQKFFEEISGERVTEESLEDEETGKVETKKIRSFSPSKVLPEFSNTADRTVTLRIDSKLLDEAESGSLSGSKKQEAERLREIIATVGKAGQPGEHIRCVVSVQMLTEGWDANTVTQILGLRAFGSQLLCEQVVGRGLRRISYDVDPVTRMLAPEYVDVYGIPFSLIPFKGRAEGAPAPADKPVTQVKALVERAPMEMTFPRVEGYVVEFKRHLIRCDVSQVERLAIQSSQHPDKVFVQATVGVKDSPGMSGSFGVTTHDRDEFHEEHHLQTTLFTIARDVTAMLVEGQKDQAAKMKHLGRHQLFPQVFRFVEEYAETRIDWNGSKHGELALDVYSKKVVGWLADAIVPDDTQGETPLMPVIDRFQPQGSTRDVLFNTTRACHPTLRSHINQVVLDTDTWERSAAFQLEASPRVVFYARNDHLGFEIPYEHLGVAHIYSPDFLVRLKDGSTLILETKGMMRDPENSKMEAAKRWVKAVNNWGRMGRWVFHVCKNIDTLNAEFEVLG